MPSLVGSEMCIRDSSLGALVLYSVCNMVFVNYIYDMIADTRFHKFHGRPCSRKRKLKNVS